MILTLLLAAATPTPAQIATARAILDDQLTDYQGSRLRKFRMVTTPGPYDADAPKPDVVALCGEIDARGPGGGLTGWRRSAIVIQDAIGPRIVAVSTNGYSGLSDFGAFCPIVGETATITPKGAVVGEEDITPALLPGAS